MKTLWQYVLNNKLITIFNLLVLGVFILPFSYHRGGLYGMEELDWYPYYLYESFEMLAFFSPLLVITIAFQLRPLQKYKRTMLTVLMILSCLYSAMIFTTLNIPVQDHYPAFGHLLTLMLGPIAWLIWAIEFKFFKLFWVFGD